MEQFEQHRENDKSERDDGVIKKRIKKGKGKKQQVNEQQTVENCSICYGEIVDQGIIQTCQHTYCFDCIEIWAKQNKTCPQCRVQFSQILRVWKQGKRKRQQMYDYPRNDVNSDDGDSISMDFQFPLLNQMPFFSRIWSWHLVLISSDSE